MNSTVADLHIHTTYSDGSLDPFELIKRLSDGGATHFSVTDHDNCGSYKDILKGLKGRDLNFIPGVEFSTKDNPTLEYKDVHILGYYIDPESKELEEYSDHIREGRYNEKKALVEALKGIGYPIEWSDVTRRVKGCFFGKPHVVEALLDNLNLHGEARQVKKEEVYKATRQFELPRKGSIPFDDVVKFIHRLGGVAVLAHPGAYRNYRAIIDMALKAGIDGLEVNYDYSYIKRLGLPQLENVEKLSEELNSIAKDKSLVISGGSDYHGDHKTISIMSAGLDSCEINSFIDMAQGKRAK